MQLQLQPRYITQHYATLIRLHYTTTTTAAATTTTTAPTTTTTTALHHTTSSSCGEVTTATIATTPKTQLPNHLWVHQWIRPGFRDSQQPTSPIGFQFWNFRHRLVRYYWYP